MYCNHFGLEEPPFRITPDTRRFFVGADRGTVLQALSYAVLAGEGMIKLTGEVGSGKTMLCRMLAERLPAQVEVIYLANPSLSREDILHAIVLELGLDVDARRSRVEVLNCLQQYLLDRARAGRQVVLFIEEAQGMPLETLEEIRLLSNLETRDSRLLQILLFGQPELNQRLAGREVRQLRDRITHSFDLAPLNAAAVRDYVRFRLQSVGHVDGEVFSPAAIRRLVRDSQGLLRRLNILADKALLAAYAHGDTQVTAAHVRQAWRDSEFVARGGLPLKHFGAVAAGLTAFSLGVASYAFVPRLTSALPPAPPTPAAAEVSVAPRGQASTPLARRQAATAAWLETADAGQMRFTIQLLLTDDREPAPLQRLLRDPRLAPLLDDIRLFRTQVQGVERWSVIYGSFSDYKVAQAALNALPEHLQVHRPYLRSLSAVVREARRTEQQQEAKT
ncbi:MAG TPA: AAA family ATPase [Arenicellales bacterium]|nr:AAA family ATPase [Arenicellales bacterium]